MHRVIYLLVPCIFIAVDAVVDAAAAATTTATAGVVVVIDVIAGAADWVLRRRLLRRRDAQTHVVSSVLQFLDPKHEIFPMKRNLESQKNVIYLDSFE